MFAYCNNNPVMHIDPTGYIMAGWSQNMSDAALRDQNAAVAVWTNQQRQQMEALARANTRQVGRAREPEGGWTIHTFETTAGGARYTFHIGNEFHHGVMRFVFPENPHYAPGNRHNLQLSEAMLIAARGVNPRAIIGRTAAGVEIEIAVHYYGHVWGPTQGFRDWASDANMGGINPFGSDQNAFIFEGMATPIHPGNVMVLFH